MTENPGTPPEQPGPPWQQPYYGPPVYYVPPPAHRSAGTALALGLVGLVGGMSCFLPILISPFAWYVGSKAIREIDASGGQLGGRDQANAGRILGIIGTVLLALSILALIAIVLLFVFSDSSGSGYNV